MEFELVDRSCTSSKFCPGLSVSYMWCNSASEELSLKRLLPVVLHFDFCFHSLIFLL